MTCPNTRENWEICYERLGPKLVLFARQYVPSLVDAEDVVQSAFVRFWRKQSDAQPEHYPLLYAAVRTTALDLLRKEGRRIRREDATAAESNFVSHFDTDLERRDEAEALAAAVQNLPPPQREVLVLRIWGDLTFAEIAVTLGDSINTVASRYRYGIEALRQILKPQEYERA